jgi:hypothetical protein
MYNAWFVLAEDTATFWVGRTIPSSSGAQLKLEAPAASPLVLIPSASGALNGDRQPGSEMYGWVISRCARRDSCAGHDVRCDDPTTPSSRHPSLTLVPIAT